MKLISCGNCAVILDADKIEWPDDIRDDDGCVIDSLAMWHNRAYYPIVKCPVCCEPIPGDEEG